MQSFTFFCDGTSYIRSNITSSSIALNPLAPVFLEMAFFAIAVSASSVNLRLTFSNAKSLSYCFMIAFLGSVNIFTSAFSSRSSSVAMTGSLPINSGIRPYFNRSSGWTNERSSPTLLSFFVFISAPKPMDFWPILFSMLFSSPTKAPPHIKSMFEVST